MYKDFGLPFQSPYIGTFLVAPCFMKLVHDVKRITTSPLTFVERSRYDYINQLKENRPFPTGLLDGNVEIQFLHYASEDEAAEKWRRRVGRSHFNRVFLKLSADKDLFTVQDLRTFDALSNSHKIAFSRNAHPDISSVVHIPEYVNDGCLMYEISLRHLNIIDWLNA